MALPWLQVDVEDRNDQDFSLLLVVVLVTMSMCRLKIQFNHFQWYHVRQEMIEMISYSHTILYKVGVNNFLFAHKVGANNLFFAHMRMKLVPKSLICTQSWCQ